MANSAASLIDQLGESLAYFEERANAFPAKLRQKKPDPVAFSATEIVYHVLDVEMLWQARFAKLLDGNERVFQKFDPDKAALESNYNMKNYEGGLHNLREARMATIATVGALSDDQLHLTGVHARFGEVDILGMLEIITAHDRQHAAQFERTLVKLGEKPTQ